MRARAHLHCSRLLLVLSTLSVASLWAAEAPGKGEVLAALKTAGGFYTTHVSRRGGYHQSYAADLSKARSGKDGKGLDTFSVTGSTTPAVGLAFLDVWEATGDRSYLEAARAAGKALILGQLCTGGWDYTTYLDPARRANIPYRVDCDCDKWESDPAPEDPDFYGRYTARNFRNKTNLDNNNTPGAMRFMMRLDRDLGFEDEEIHEASLFALNGLVRSQYPNGAWPQRWSRFHDPKDYPVKRASYPDSWPDSWRGYNFYTHYTFNDDGIANMIDVMLEATEIYAEPRYLTSAKQAGEFIFLAQMPEPQPAWAQQYDVNMHPVWARYFEPPAICGRESLGVMRALMLLYRETGEKEYLEPIPRALAYLQNSTYERGGRTVFARFYEFKTNKPLYITKGMSMVGSVTLKRPIDGYEVSYSDASIVSHYSLSTRAEALDTIEQEYQAIVAADAAALKRPARLKGLAPGFHRPQPPLPADELAQKAREAIDSLDERGAWVTVAPEPERDMFLRVRPNRNMIVRIHGVDIPLDEDATLKIVEAETPPVEAWIHSGTFIANIRTLANYYVAIAGAEGR